jgi:IS4 transposase
VKLHFTLDHDGYLPTLMVVTDGKEREVATARQQTFAPGTIVVFDRGYLHFGWFAELTAGGVFFVTRARDDLAFEIVTTAAVPQHRAIQADQHIRLTAKHTRRVYPTVLRRVVAVTAEGDELVFLTNHLGLGASTIARIYKDRWQIELLFKTLKQHLRVKTFVGTSANALHVQIWTALIALLVLKYLQLKARFGWSVSNLVALLRMNLFVYRDLWSWLNEPFTAPPLPPEPLQQALAFR